MTLIYITVPAKNGSTYFVYFSGSNFIVCFIKFHYEIGYILMAQCVTSKTFQGQ